MQSQPPVPKSLLKAWLRLLLMKFTRHFRNGAIRTKSTCRKQSKDKAEIALFVGDDAKYLWPAALESALKLLEAVGVKPVLIGIGRSNGYLASSLGFPETAKMLVQATLNELKASGARRMLVLTPGDYYAFTTFAD